MRKSTTIDVNFKVTIVHRDDWSEDELLQFSEDLVSYKWPEGWAIEGIEEWYVTNKQAEIDDAG